MRKLGLTVLLAASPALAIAAETDTANRIVDIAYNHGQVVQTVAHLTDQIGPRLTNSPGMREAERWTQGQFKAWGLHDVHAEGFEFGRGWWIESSSVRMTAPRPLALRAIPVAWTPATNGTIAADIIVAPMSDEKHFAALKGKLAGKIVLVSFPADPKDDTDAPFERLTDAKIRELDSFPAPSTDTEALKAGLKRRSLALKLDAFLKAEGAVAWPDAGLARRRDFGRGLSPPGAPGQGRPGRAGIEQQRALRRQRQQGLQHRRRHPRQRSGRRLRDGRRAPGQLDRR